MNNRSWLAVLLIVMAFAAASCGRSEASLRISVSPNPVRIYLQTCAGVFAMFPCSREDLFADFTVSVSTSDVGGQGGITFVVVDAASGEPLPDQEGSASGGSEVVLAPNGSVAQPVRWTWPVPGSGPGRNLPPQLSFVITVQLTDTMGNRVAETVTVPEQLPRGWQVF